MHNQFVIKFQGPNFPQIEIYLTVASRDKFDSDSAKISSESKESNMKFDVNVPKKTKMSKIKSLQENTPFSLSNGLSPNIWLVCSVRERDDATSLFAQKGRKFQYLKSRQL